MTPATAGVFRPDNLQAGLWLPAPWLWRSRAALLPARSKHRSKKPH